MHCFRTLSVSRAARNGHRRDAGDAVNRRSMSSGIFRIAFAAFHVFLEEMEFDPVLVEQTTFLIGAAMARVLLAESDHRIREFIAGVLSDCGHAVEACANGVEASASLKGKAIDVVVTDLVLVRSQDGIFGRACAALGIPTITLSGREFRPDQAVAEWPLPFLEKPFRFADLQCVLDAIAARCQSARAIHPGTRRAA
jgi:CheY-like chemotaxis protein